MLLLKITRQLSNKPSWLDVQRMGVLELMNAYGSMASFSHCHNFNRTISSPTPTLTFHRPSNSFTYSRLKTRATSAQSQEAATSQEPPCVNIAFIHPVLLPDGTPDVHFRNACGGQKLRDIMLDTNIDLYGPYARPLLNCSGGGTCGTCVVEVIEGRELLSPKTDKEKEKLSRSPKHWRLACQTTVGKADSTGLLVIQQMPEWKGHEWTIGREPPPDSL